MLRIIDISSSKYWDISQRRLLVASLMWIDERKTVYQEPMLPKEYRTCMLWVPSGTALCSHCLIVIFKLRDLCWRNESTRADAFFVVWWQEYASLLNYVLPVPVLAALFWGFSYSSLPCPDSPILIVFSWLSCPSCLVPAVLSWLSRPSCPGGSLLDFLSNCTTGNRSWL